MSGWTAVQIRRRQVLESSMTGCEMSAASPERPGAGTDRRHPHRASGVSQALTWALKRAIFANSSASSDAPPTSAPSTSGLPMICAALPDLTEPP